MQCINLLCYRNIELESSYAYLSIRFNLHFIEEIVDRLIYDLIESVTGCIIIMEITKWRAGKSGVSPYFTIGNILTPGKAFATFTY